MEEGWKNSLQNNNIRQKEEKRSAVHWLCFRSLFGATVADDWRVYMMMRWAKRKKKIKTPKAAISSSAHTDTWKETVTICIVIRLGPVVVVGGGGGGGGVPVVWQTREARWWSFFGPPVWPQCSVGRQHSRTIIFLASLSLSLSAASGVSLARLRQQKLDQAQG